MLTRESLLVPPNPPPSPNDVYRCPLAAQVIGQLSLPGDSVRAESSSNDTP